MTVDGPLSTMRGHGEVRGKEDGDELVETSLEWNVENGRHDLPWRDLNVSPFEVFVAELMLQQTSAEQVRDVYDEFGEQYQTAGALLAAPEADVFEAIEPLGLRKRTAYFRRAAAQLLARHDGRVADSRSELLDLHGVGEYTAASVLAHAYGRDASAVGTNVARALNRVFGLGLAEEPEASEMWELTGWPPWAGATPSSMRSSISARRSARRRIRTPGRVRSKRRASTRTGRQ